MVLRFIFHASNNLERLDAFLGVTPFEKHSGTSVRGRSRMSKIGPPEIIGKL
ncbi:IS110 family transposase [Kluyvera sp. Awk 3]|uniref:Transposase IS116/IS110/IS902 C-terminal domain-containing protein n=1 Tax=Kluyvera genomosp. 3 TaxID=2774055 RepID=A0A248KJK1_9ENTR|nr:transposase [Kluyvera sp. Awk 3]ASG64033.1 hypothetical protein CEW81_19430 [Kluyvera genomosp. 3]MDA8489900.1 IS110 family transposase [Kluyvera sp. Awk 3]